MDTSTLQNNPFFLKKIIADQAIEIADHKAEIACLAEQVRLLKALRFLAQSEKAQPSKSRPCRLKSSPKVL